MSEEVVIVTKYCSNCKKDIAEANFTMHEVHCRRHLVLCQHCQEPVPRTEMDQHFTDVHAKVACTQCSMELEKEQMDAHLEKDCAKRQMTCEFCELQLPYCDLGEHLEFCGTRTEACPRCGNFIMHKDLQRHNASNCTYPEVKPPPQAPSYTDGCGAGGDRFAADRGGVFGGVFRADNLDDSFDPFVFEEIRRALEGDADQRGVPQTMAEDSDASAAAGGFGRRGQRGVAVLGRKNDTRGGLATWKATTSKRSEINRQRERASSPAAIPPDVDYDSMLAMQLHDEHSPDPLPAFDPDPLPALDLDPDAELNRLITNYENRSQQHHHVATEMDDATMPASPPSPQEEFSVAGRFRF